MEGRHHVASGITDRQTPEVEDAHKTPVAAGQEVATLQVPMNPHRRTGPGIGVNRGCPQRGRPLLVHKIRFDSPRGLEVEHTFERGPRDWVVRRHRPSSLSRLDRRAIRCVQRLAIAVKCANTSTSSERSPFVGTSGMPLTQVDTVHGNGYLSDGSPDAIGRGTGNGSW